RPFGANSTTEAGCCSRPLRLLMPVPSWLHKQQIHLTLIGWAIIQNRFLGAGLGAHTFGTTFRSRPESCSQGSAEIIILLPPMRTIRSSSAVLDTLSFHLIMTVPRAVAESPARPICHGNI